jgi:hypothetical protein
MSENTEVQSPNSDSLIRRAWNSLFPKTETQEQVDVAAQFERNNPGRRIEGLNPDQAFNQMTERFGTRRAGKVILESVRNTGTNKKTR